MNWYCRLITNLKYLWKILIHYDPQASWIYFINVLLCSDFSRLVGNGGSIFYRDIRDLWSVCHTNSCTEVPQDSKKLLVTYYWVSNKRYDQLSVTPDKNMKMNKRYATQIPLISVMRDKMFKNLVILCRQFSFKISFYNETLEK